MLWLEAGSWSWRAEPTEAGELSCSILGTALQGQLQGEQAVAVCLQLAVVRPGLSLTWDIFKDDPR